MSFGRHGCYACILHLEREFNFFSSADKKKASQTDGLGFVNNWWYDVEYFRIVTLDGHHRCWLQVAVGGSGLLVGCGHVFKWKFMTTTCDVFSTKVDKHHFKTFHERHNHPCMEQTVHE